MVENRAIREALDQRIAELETAHVISPARLSAIQHQAAGVRLSGPGMDDMSAPLLAVCEGRQSPSRQLLNISSRHWAYNQTAFVATFAHEFAHHGCATERFFADGPFAMLPMTGNYSSIVWALDNKLAASVARLDDADFAAEVQHRFGDDLGELTLVSPRWHYPLSLIWADDYVADRAVLVGDAARGIHPIAGQGWNLAVRDIATIAEIAVDRLRLGLDPGSADALEGYAAWRRFDGLALVAVTDGINRLFANDILPVKLARNLGLGLVDRSEPAKGFFMRHAMGLAGNLPRTMRGEAF
ncbi:MAG: FAD-dependent monooxygenase [Pseudomonadota bacterium]